jgi:CheY-like chemotaxis protein
MKTKTILVIEDNKLNMKLVKELINIGKYRMLEANQASSKFASNSRILS